MLGPARRHLLRVLGLTFGLAVIVGNTIRLDIESRREEIVVMKLIGAPDGFIRRPFLYAGFWQVVRHPWELVSGGTGSGLFVLDLRETVVADDLWPLPTYREMLFIK